MPGTDVTVSGSGHTPERAAAAFRAASEQQMRRAMMRVQAEAQRLTPTRTGNLRRSITSLIDVGPDGVITGSVGTNVFYGEYVERGTGIFGPYHQRIYPVHAKALRWPGGGGGFTQAGRRRKGAAGASAGYRYAASIKGMEPQRFFRQATENTTAEVQGDLEQIATVAQKLLMSGERL